MKNNSAVAATEMKSQKNFTEKMNSPSDIRDMEKRKLKNMEKGIPFAHGITEINCEI